MTSPLTDSNGGSPSAPTLAPPFAQEYEQRTGPWQRQGFPAKLGMPRAHWGRWHTVAGAAGGAAGTWRPTWLE